MIPKTTIETSVAVGMVDGKLLERCELRADGQIAVITWNDSVYDDTIVLTPSGAEISQFESHLQAMCKELCEDVRRKRPQGGESV